MADNVAITAGTGTSVASDDIGGVQFQRVKIALGADGAHDGDLDPGSAAAAASLPVTASTEDVARVGIITETAPATDTASSGLNGRLQRIAQRLTSLIALLPTALGANGGLKIEGVASGTTVPVTPAATEGHLGEVGGNLVMISTEFTRPSDTTAYAAGDAVSNDTTTTTMQALANAARVSGGSGYITGIRITTDKKSITPRFRIHFWNTNGATVSGDNLAFKSVYADISKRVGYWDMPAMITPADTTNSDQSNAIDLTVRIPYTCAATSLYYTLEVLDAFTPASAEKVSVTIFADRN